MWSTAITILLHDICRLLDVSTSLGQWNIAESSLSKLPLPPQAQTIRAPKTNDWRHRARVPVQTHVKRRVLSFTISPATSLVNLNRGQNKAWTRSWVTDVVTVPPHTHHHHRTTYWASQASAGKRVATLTILEIKNHTHQTQSRQYKCLWWSCLSLFYSGCPPSGFTGNIATFNTSLRLCRYTQVYLFTRELAAWDRPASLSASFVGVGGVLW